jgi:hypothetical protein
VIGETKNGFLRKEAKGFKAMKKWGFHPKIQRAIESIPSGRDGGNDDWRLAVKEERELSRLDISHLRTKCY